MDWKVGQRAAPFDCYSGVLRYASTIKAIRYNYETGTEECQFNPPTEGGYMDWNVSEFPNNDPWTFWFDLDYVESLEVTDEKDLDKTSSQICDEVLAESGFLK